MKKDVQNDFVLSHSIINYLQSSYQGVAAALNVQNQLNWSNFNPEQLTTIKERVVKIRSWWDDLWQGNALVSATWERPQTFDANKAFEWLAELRPNLEWFATNVHSAINRRPFGAEQNEIKFLVAAFARYAYARDNYVRGLIELGNRVGNTGIAEEYTGILDEAREELSVIHSLLSTFKEGQQSEAFLESLINECIKLPGVFLTHVHDLNQLLTVLNPKSLTFESLGYSPEQVKLWKKLKMTPVAAGYWVAHGIAPQEIPGWHQLGMSSAADASAWAARGFNPRTALPWLQAGFTAHLALLWAQGGASPEQAQKLASEGSPPPSLIVSYLNKNS